MTSQKTSAEEATSYIISQFYKFPNTKKKGRAAENLGRTPRVLEMWFNSVSNG